MFGPGGRQVWGIVRVSARAFLWISDPPTPPLIVGGCALPPPTGGSTARHGFVGGGYVYIYPVALRACSATELELRGLFFGTLPQNVFLKRRQSSEALPGLKAWR